MRVLLLIAIFFCCVASFSNAEKTEKIEKVNDTTISIKTEIMKNVDKADLIKQKERIEKEIVDLQGELAKINNMLDVLK